MARGGCSVGIIECGAKELTDFVLTSPPVPWPPGPGAPHPSHSQVTPAAESRDPHSPDRVPTGAFSLSSVVLIPSKACLHMLVTFDVNCSPFYPIFLSVFCFHPGLLPAVHPGSFLGPMLIVAPRVQVTSLVLSEFRLCTSSCTCVPLIFCV